MIISQILNFKEKNLSIITNKLDNVKINDTKIQSNNKFTVNKKIIMKI